MLEVQKAFHLLSGSQQHSTCRQTGQKLLNADGVWRSQGEGEVASSQVGGCCLLANDIHLNESLTYKTKCTNCLSCCFGMLFCVSGSAQACQQILQLYVFRNVYNAYCSNAALPGRTQGRHSHTNRKRCQKECLYTDLSMGCCTALRSQPWP